MATRTIVSLVDDIDGSVAQQTVHLGLDGEHFEVDVNTAHAAQLRDDLRIWVEAARPTRQRGRTTAARTATSGTSAAAIRQWAHQHGTSCPARGRIPNAVREAFVRASEG